MMRHRTQVREWMTEHPLTVTPDLPLLDALNLMLANDVRRLPVVDADGSLVGMVTRSDIQRAHPYERALLATEEEEDFLAMAGGKVAELMAFEPESVSPEDTIQDAAERMIDFQVSGLPVVDEDRLVGIITESDIFRLVVESWGEFAKRAVAPG